MPSWIFKMENSIFGYEIIRVYGVKDFEIARNMAVKEFKERGPGCIEWRQERIESLYNEKLNNKEKCLIEDGSVIFRT
jgi:hypothetical protein